MRQNCRRKITGQRYFKNGCVRHVIETARGEGFAVVHENLLWKNGTSSWRDIQVSSLRLVLKGKQRRFICS